MSTPEIQQEALRGSSARADSSLPSYPAQHPAERILVRGVARCAACQKPFRPARAWQHFCSPVCRKDGYKARQHLLDFTPEPEPLPPPIDPTVPNADGRRLRGQNAAILARLRQGPARNVELVQLALKYTSRISDIRAYLRPLGETIPEPRDLGGGLTEYRIARLVD